MFKELGSLMGLLGRAGEIQQRMKVMAEELKTKRVEGTAGGGMVTIEVNGAMDVLKTRIDPSLLSGDRELLEDLITAAMNQAITKARQLHAECLKNATGGIEGLEGILGAGGMELPTRR